MLFSAALALSLLDPGCASLVAVDQPTAHPTFTNPLKDDGADPWMTYYDGAYYLSTTTGRDVRLRRSTHLGELSKAADVVVWRDQTATRNKGLWAPEFHLLDTAAGKRWFLYYTACDGKEPNHRIHVCQSASTDPRGPYQYKGQLKTDERDQYYAIDATVLTQKDGKLYLIWCGRPSEFGQGLYIAPMSDPLTISGPRLSLPASGFGHDPSGKEPPVREGPEIIQHGGTTFLVYSSSSADSPDYKLGALVCDDTADPMNLKSWKQHPTPLLTRNDAARVYGPGHNYFFKSPDGTEDWIVYHVKLTTKITYKDRATFAQRITWSTDGLPDLGIPQPVGTPIKTPAGETR